MSSNSKCDTGKESDLSGENPSHLLVSCRCLDVDRNLELIDGSLVQCGKWSIQIGHNVSVAHFCVESWVINTSVLPVILGFGRVFKGPWFSKCKCKFNLIFKMHAMLIVLFDFYTCLSLCKVGCICSQHLHCAWVFVCIQALGYCWLWHSTLNVNI